jgi:hypothetical protein
MKKNKNSSLRPGTLYQVIHPNDEKKSIYAVLVNLEISEPYALMIPVYQFSREGKRLIISIPDLLSKKLEKEFFRIPTDDILRTIYFQGETISLSQDDLNFVSKEALYYVVGSFNQQMIAHRDQLTDDEIALESLAQFNRDAINMFEWLSQRIFQPQQEPSKKMEIFQYGLYRVFLFGEIGSEKSGVVDVVVWQKYVNHQLADKSTFFCFPISYEAEPQQNHRKIPILINRKQAWVNIAQGRRISFLRFDHPIYDQQLRKPTLVLSKADIQDINAAFISHYAKI